MEWIKKLSKNQIFYIFTPLLALIDIVVKLFVKYNVENEVVVIKDFFSIFYHENLGAGFSILRGQKFFLMFVSLLAIGLIWYYYEDIPKNASSFVMLILAGVIGNLFDRIVFGYVIDFFNFSFWPVFNIADIYITVGAILLIIFWWREKE